MYVTTFEKYKVKFMRQKSTIIYSSTVLVTSSQPHIWTAPTCATYFYPTYKKYVF